MGQRKDQRTRDLQFAEVVQTSHSTAEAMSRLGITDERNYRRRLRDVQRRLDQKLLHGGENPEQSVQTSAREAQLREKVALLQSENGRLRGLVAGTQTYKALIHGMERHEPDPPRWLLEHDTAPDFLGVPTLFLSDLHWDELIDPKQVGGKNEFNREIAVNRLYRTTETAIRLLKHTLSPAKYPGIVVPLGGDMMSGYIHEELRENAEATLFESLLCLMEHLIAVVQMLKDEFGKVFVPCVVGNHGRLDKKPRAKHAVHDNVDWLLYQLLARYFEHDPDISFQIPDSLDAVYSVLSTTYLLTHGDQFKGGSGISGPWTPWALGDFRKRKRQEAIDNPFDIMIFGHWHMLRWGGGWICNGSMKGYDEFAFGRNFDFERALQALWLTHPGYGVRFKMEVECDPITHDRPETPWVAVFGE